MSQNALQQTLTSQSLSANSVGSQSNVTQEQVTKFLGATVEAGGSNGEMAQDLLQLMQQKPEVADNVAQQLETIVQLASPRETQVAQALDVVCVGYQQQIAGLPDMRGTVARQTAGGELARALQTVTVANTPENRALIRQMQQGKMLADSPSQQKLEKLFSQAQEAGYIAELPQLMRQFAKAAPESRETVQKSLSGYGEARSESKEPNTLTTGNTEQITTAQLPKDSALALSLVYPTAQATVNEAQAEHAARAVLQNNKVTITGLVQAPLDNMMLQAASLGLKTFSDTAEAVGKSVKINGDAQAKLTDKKVADYQDQLNKAQEQEKQSKKAKVWAAIFSPITTIIKAIVKPIMDLIKKIPGVETALNWLSKHVSEIALPLTIIASLVCPMSLPLMLGLGVSTVAAGFSIAEKAMGDKAPSWLKITDQVGDMMAGVAMMVSIGGMLGTFDKIRSGMDKAKSFFNIQEKIKLTTTQMQNTASVFEGVTAIGDGVSQGVINTKKAHLQKDIDYIDANLTLNDTLMEWLKTAQASTTGNLESIIQRSSTVSESASRMIAETGSLRARLANSIV